jgi:hypothetical protein
MSGHRVGVVRGQREQVFTRWARLCGVSAYAGDRADQRHSALTVCKAFAIRSHPTTTGPRMAYPGGMTGPRPSFTPSRLNVGGYGVRVEWYDRDVTAPRWAKALPQSHRRLGILPWGFRVAQVGRLHADGSLSVEPEPWRARHYRRAVMAGAGVYRLGLWAFLAAGRGYTFTAPAPGASVEPHRVRVYGWQVSEQVPTYVEIPDSEDMGWISRLCAGRPLEWVRMSYGKVAAGCLALTPAAWRTRRYARALMRGAGVYQAGLWAMLAHRPQTDAQAGAALGKNDAGTLARFTLAAHGRVRHSVRWRMGRKWRERRAYMARHFVRGEAHVLDKGRRVLMGWFPKKAQPRRTWQRQARNFIRAERWEESLRHFFPGDPSQHETCGIDLHGYDCFKNALSAVAYGDRDAIRLDRRAQSLSMAAWLGMSWGVSALLQDMTAYRPDLAPMLARLRAQGDAYRAHLARRVKAQRPPARLPRPLHAHPRPPAAPLAPPAL